MKRSPKGQKRRGVGFGIEVTGGGIRKRGNGEKAVSGVVGKRFLKAGWVRVGKRN